MIDAVVLEVHSSRGCLDFCVGLCRCWVCVCSGLGWSLCGVMGFRFGFEMYFYVIRYVF